MSAAGPAAVRRWTVAAMVFVVIAALVVLVVSNAGELRARLDGAWELVRQTLAGGSAGRGGVSPTALSLLLFFFVFVSEDLSCIAGGLLAANGNLPFAGAVAACFAGIWVSDLGLYLIGRAAGPRMLRLGFVRRLIDEALEARVRAAYAARGVQVVFATRFLPGSRVAAYLTAGALRLGFVRFSLWLMLAAALWTPVLVGAAWWVGRPLLAWWERYGLLAVPVIGLSLLVLYLSSRVLLRLLTHRGRRQLRGAWLRWTRWEFWPAWLFYLPVAAGIVRLALRFRSATLWAAANPGIEPLGGLAMESKSRILSRLEDDGTRVAGWTAVPAGDPDSRLERVRAFQRDLVVPWPLVLKPDVGQRGEGVAVLADERAVMRYLESNPAPLIAQAYASGRELGVFYTRRPGEPEGALFSITEKVLPEVAGDGRRTLEELILDDPRAVALARHYLKVNAGRLGTVPGEGERVRLVDLGTHCRGAVFLDGERWMSEALRRALDEVVAGFDGFCFGRFDLKFAGDDPADGFRILELNGVSSESTDIYDPANNVFAAWRKLQRQWELAFRLGELNRRRGAPVPTLREVLRVLRAHRQREPFELPAGGYNAVREL